MTPKERFEAALRASGYSSWERANAMRVSLAIGVIKGKTLTERQANKLHELSDLLQLHLATQQ